MAGYALGIDIGTTWTAAAIARPGSEPQVVALGGRSAAVPTVVHLSADGTASIGDAAERRAATDPDRVAREFKRRIGDTTPVLVGGQPWSPESLMATVLRWVVARVSELEGEAPGSILVTHPANWGPLRRELFEQAVAGAGVAVRFITEPEAAAVHYASAARVPDGTLIGVYDLGGGTFDATVLRKEGDGFAMLGQPGGVERLGGLDFDAAVLAHVSGLLGPAWTALDPADATTVAAVARLRADTVLAKEALSEDADAVIAVALPTVATEIRLTRGELEAMIRPAIEQSADAFERAVAAAGVSADQLDRILLVGGSSRIPLVSQVLANRFGRPLALDTHPKHAVAEGAARLALAGDAAPPAVIPAFPAAVVAAAAVPVLEPEPEPPAPVPVAAPEPTPAPEPAPAMAAALPPTEALPEPEPAGAGGGRKFPIWIPIVAVVAIVGIVAALALGGGGGDGDDEESTDSTEEDGSSDGSTAFDPEVVQTLDGSWFFSGAATECEGFSDDECATFESDFSSDFVIFCDGEICVLGVGESDAQQLSDDGETGLIAAGFLSDNDGFACDDAPDPTEWQVIIDDIDTDGDNVATGFDATFKFTSQDGGSDGNSCDFQQVVAEGTATRTDDGGSSSSSAGAVTVTLDWSSNADLDLDVFDPDGSSGEPGEDANSGCPEDTESGQEVVTFDDPLSGTYSIQVVAFEVDSDICGSGDYVVTVSIEGEDDQTFEGTLSSDETGTHEFEVP